MSSYKGFSATRSYDITNSMTKTIIRKIEYLENEIKRLPLENSLQKNEIEKHLRNITDHCQNMLNDVRAERFD